MTGQDHHRNRQVDDANRPGHQRIENRSPHLLHNKVCVHTEQSVVQIMLNGSQIDAVVLGSRMVSGDQYAQDRKHCQQ